MTSPTPADLAQWVINAATVLAGLLGTVAQGDCMSDHALLYGRCAALEKDKTRRV